MTLTPTSPDWTPERRRALRVDVPPARAEIVRPDGALPVVLRQISERGMLVEGDAPIRPDTTCDVTLAVAGYAPLGLTGRVVHSRTAGAPGHLPRARYVTALALHDVGATEREALRVLVAALAPLERPS